jgi:predicted Rdx family selenoprotein
MLRAAYFGQELLSTFGTTIGEIALIPATGGIFTVNLTYKPQEEVARSGDDVQATTVLLWDRKAEEGFPGDGPLSSNEKHVLTMCRDQNLETAYTRPS